MKEGEGIKQQTNKKNHIQHIDTDDSVVTGRGKEVSVRWRWAKWGKWGQKETLLGVMGTRCCAQMMFC